MNIDEQFDNFLAELGVEMERPEDRQFNSDSFPEITIHQASRDHYGVFYRLDLIDQKPELRIMIPVDRGDVKTDIYLVRLSDLTILNTTFVEMSIYPGSDAYEHGREAALQHLLYAVAEMMKQLFWSGDIQTLSFPPEIKVYPLLLHEDRRTDRRRLH
ncbi:MAG TPA: hypothetical protein VGL94_01485 [Ktedonobacteraceae bacterium]|jgi:hypothetical protein